jgi:hypothetical protein
VAGTGDETPGKMPLAIDRDLSARNSGLPLVHIRQGRTTTITGEPA